MGCFYDDQKHSNQTKKHQKSRDEKTEGSKNRQKPKKKKSTTWGNF